MTAVKETLDDYLKTILGQKGVLNLDKDQLEQKLAMMNQKSNTNKYDFDQATKARVASLWKERTQGRFKSDREGFAKAFLVLSETATYDTSKPIGSNHPLGLNEVDPEKIFNQVSEEREQMTYELTEQLALRVKEHLFLKERKASDFVRPRRSEISIFNNQVQSHENRAKTLEEQVAQIDNGKEPGFDKEAY